MSTPSSKRSKPSTSEEVINKTWDCVRTSNGIMYLLNLLHKKTPITDADEIRALACRALVGLSRSETARQIMSKLPMFTSGQLQLLMREPVLQDKRIEHGRFQRSALELIKVISGKSKHESADGSCPDITIQSIHRADVVAQTKIQFNKKQLLQLIQGYLNKEGYSGVANALQKEANLPSLPPAKAHLMGPPSRTASLSSPILRNGWFMDSSGSYRQFCSPHSKCNIHSPNANSSSTGNNSSSSTPNSLSSQSIHIKINKKSKLTSSLQNPSLCNGSLTCLSISTNNSSVSPFSKSENMSANGNHLNNLNCNSPSPNLPGRHNGFINHLEPHNININETGISLEKIVSEYLASQHALCKNPVVTCPPFDLFTPHRCPEPKTVKASPNNITMKFLNRPYMKPKLSREFAAQNRKFVYSRYRPSNIYRPPESSEVFLCCEFSFDDQFLMVGTTKGEVRMYNKNGSNDEGVYSVHQGPVTSLTAHKNGSLLLTSCSSVHDCALWGTNELFINKFTIPNCDHAIFTNAQDKILGSYEQTAKLYDLNTKQEISSFSPKLSNHYRVNQAALDPNDELILTDGVLFDVKSGKQIHKFDKINPIINGIFHRNGLEVISSSEIWDLRTFHLLKTVPILELCDISFNRASDVIFGIFVGDVEESQENAFETSFKTIDASNYSSIGKYFFLIFKRLNKHVFLQ